ncbi:hypothetical protein D9M68_844890 [compost metagenome]
MENLMEAFTLDCPGNPGQSSRPYRDWNLRPSRDFQVQASAPNPDSSGDDGNTRSGSDGVGPGRSYPGSSP